MKMVERIPRDFAHLSTAFDIVGDNDNATMFSPKLKFLN